MFWIFNTFSGNLHLGLYSDLQHIQILMSSLICHLYANLLRCQVVSQTITARQTSQKVPHFYLLFVNGRCLPKDKRCKPDWAQQRIQTREKHCQFHVALTMSINLPSQREQTVKDESHFLRTEWSDVPAEGSLAFTGDISRRFPCPRLISGRPVKRLQCFDVYKTQRSTSTLPRRCTNAHAPLESLLGYDWLAT